MRIAGLDEAGRGSVMGPLIIAGACLPEQRIEKLEEIGVKDSKLLSPTQRERLYPLIRRICEVTWVRVKPQEVDEFVLKGKKLRRLNYLEALKMAEIVDKLNPDQVYVDSSDILPERFKIQIESHLRKRSNIFSFHHADRDFPVVSAASIVAKVIRDREANKLRRIIGDFGSGYPSDLETISFLWDWVKVHKVFPPGTRASWKTLKKVVQLTLD